MNALASTTQALQTWHRMIDTREMSLLDELLAEDVVFYSPVAFNPYTHIQVRQ